MAVLKQYDLEARSESFFVRERISLNARLLVLR
jgi:hypothetical protein